MNEVRIATSLSGGGPAAVFSTATDSRRKSPSGVALMRIRAVSGQRCRTIRLAVGELDALASEDRDRLVQCHYFGEVVVSRPVSHYFPEVVATGMGAA